MGNIQEFIAAVGENKGPAPIGNLEPASLRKVGGKHVLDDPVIKIHHGVTD